jgi:hypothetical protein
MVKRNTHPVVSGSETIDFLTAQVAEPPVFFKDLGVVDYLSLSHDSTTLGRIVVPSHIWYLLD